VSGSFLSAAAFSRTTYFFTEISFAAMITMFKLTAIAGLLFATAIFATIPISPQVTSRGLELSVDQAQAVTYGRARRVTRPVVRRDYRYTRRAVRRGAVYYGAPYRRCRC
jgi:hypothetical protein